MADFEIEKFLDAAGAVKTDDLDWEACARAGITAEEERVLLYMSDTESHSILNLRDLLAGHSTRDPEVTSFLSAWVYEELCHGRAIDRLLAAVGRAPERGRYARVTEGTGLRELTEAALSRAAAALTPRFMALHMTWGAINELSAAAAYQRLAQTTANPVLATLVQRMAKQERRHFSFYWHQARKRLTGDPSAQRLARFGIRRFWHLVGSESGGDSNLDFVSAYLFATPDARRGLAAAEDSIRELPGMAWFDLLTRHVEARVAAWNVRRGYRPDAPGAWPRAALAS